MVHREGGAGGRGVGFGGACATTCGRGLSYHHLRSAIRRKHRYYIRRHHDVRQSGMLVGARLLVCSRRIVPYNRVESVQTVCTNHPPS